ncbi:Zn-dependent hydrolase [Rhizobium leguminosarum]|uniref:Zn-dependent hydrolase n=1 Tax=Rhizobium leguminosarum TaxID=384 RepID=UPI0024A801AB|nr:Zn-dependent hydrolase [Rhizobium leguminosarum]MDI5930020.1 Zn-dependent hydrolase [Rhizobium leguminosarum]
MGSPEISSDRLWSDLMTMGAIGATSRGGSCRVALSDADCEGRNLFCYWAREAGLDIKIDQAGNIFARREGLDPTLPPLMIGSHLDTQTPGGKFDGVLGVLAGLEVVRALNRADVKTKRAIEIVDWTNEEGARFPGLMGSGIFAGKIPLETALTFTDKDGYTVGSELKRIGYAGSAPVGGRDVYRYLELHIEQGDLLQNSGAIIGAVTNSSWWGGGTIKIHGENGHSQTAPMSRRRNALIGAAKLALEIEAIGARHEPEGMVSATVIDCLPNNLINIPHLCTLKYLIVHATEDGREDVITRIRDAMAKIAAETSLSTTDDYIRYRERQDFDERLLKLTEHVASELGYPSMRLPTLTGHDALNTHFVCPTGIIFVPCKDGISHSELEWCEPEHAYAGARVLLRAALVVANEA